MALGGNSVVLGSKINPLAAVKDLKRAKYILSVIFRYGFEDAASRLHLPFQPVVQRMMRVEPELPRGQRLRMMLEELGPTFIKLGQFFSMRPDILPPDIILELQKLQDEVPPLPFPIIRTVVEKSLGGKVEDYFSSFDPQPLASASIAQVHLAHLKKDKRKVVCKVRRAGIEQTIRSDFNLIAFFAHQAHERIRELRHYELPRVVEEAGANLFLELNFENEKANLLLYRRLAEAAEETIVPQIEEELSSSSLLVMEEVKGIKVGRLQDKEIRQKAARNLAQAFFHQLMICGFFHADPHAGNVRFTEDGQVIFLDWGLAGRLSWKMRFKLAEFLEAALGGDPSWVVDCGLTLSGEIEVEDREGLEKDILILLDQFRVRQLKKVDMGRALVRMFEMLCNHRIRVNPHYLLVGRSLMNLEGLIRELDPEFDLFLHARHYLVQLNQERWKPARFWVLFRKNFYQTVALLEGLPGRLNNIINKLEKGRLTIVYQHTGLEKVIQTLKLATDRLVIGMILAALIIGSSLIIFTGVKPTLFGYPLLGLIGYLISAVLGLWIIYISFRDRLK